MIINKLVNYEKAKTYTKDVIELSQPLVDHLGITGFCYHKVFNDQSEILLANDPLWVQTVYENNLAINAEYVPNFKAQGFKSIIWMPGNKEEIYLAVREYCSWFYGYTLSNDNNEYFGFSVAGDHDLKNVNIFVNNVELLERFCLFFVQKAEKIIADMSKYDGANNSETNFAVYDKSEKQQKLYSFASQTPLDRVILTGQGQEGVVLTSTELDVLLATIRGMSSSEIADSKFRSPRTIQTHIENIKDKFAVSSRSNLIQRALDFGLHRFL